VIQLVVALAGLGLALTLPPWPGAAVIVAAMIAVSRVSWRRWLAALAGPVAFIGVGSAVLAFDDPARAVSTGLRSIAATSSTMLLVLTQPVAKWLALGSRVCWLAPLADVALLAHRLIHCLAEVTRVTERAQRMRLSGATWRARMRGAQFQAARILPESARRARALERALDCRLAGKTLRVML